MNIPEFKVMVTPEESQNIQETIFALGGLGWFGEDKTVSHLDAPYLFYDSHGGLFCLLDMPSYLETPYPRFTYEELIQNLERISSEVERSILDTWLDDEDENEWVIPWLDDHEEDDIWGGGSELPEESEDRGEGGYIVTEEDADRLTRIYRGVYDASRQPDLEEVSEINEDDTDSDLVLSRLDNDSQNTNITTEHITKKDWGKETDTIIDNLNILLGYNYK